MEARLRERRRQPCVQRQAGLGVHSPGLQGLLLSASSKSEITVLLGACIVTTFS